MTLKMVLRNVALTCLFAKNIASTAQCNGNVVMMAGGLHPVVLHATNSSVQFDDQIWILLAPAIRSDSVSAEVGEDLPNGKFIGFYLDSSKAVMLDKSPGRF